MKKTCFLILSLFCTIYVQAQNNRAINPIIESDLPDMSMIRVNDTYYMSCTTMHMSPGVPILKSKDLSNWEMVSYCYDTLGDKDELNLVNGKSNYGKGTWASCFRYHNNRFYVSTFSQTTNQTYIFQPMTRKVGNGKNDPLHLLVMTILSFSMMTDIPISFGELGNYL